MSVLALKVVFGGGCGRHDVELPLPLLPPPTTTTRRQYLRASFLGEP